MKTGGALRDAPPVKLEDTNTSWVGVRGQAKGSNYVRNRIDRDEIIACKYGCNGSGMSSIVIRVEDLSKAYHLGQIGTGMISRDLKVWWARVRGKPNPQHKIGQMDHRNRAGETIWALKEINFQVERGEVLGIIGRNGAGKSTLLKILSHITAPTYGRIKIRGRIASLLEVGTGFHPELTGRENIFLNGAILGMNRKEIRDKFDQIVDFSDVEKFIDTPVKRYSSGMYVRLAFAVAAHLETEILLVDEVLAVGDIEFQKKCLGKMGEVARDGRTVLFVSHNMGAIQRQCTTGINLDKGEIAYQGPIAQTINHYLATNQLVSTKEIKIDPQIPFQILFIRVVDGSRKEKSRFHLDEPIRIELKVRILRDLNNSHVNLSVSYNGSPLFRSMDTDFDPQVRSKRKRGEYLECLMLDSRVFKPGTYSISVDAGGLGHQAYYKEIDAVSFEIYDQNGDFDRSWAESRQGLIKCPGVWELTRL